MSDANDDDHGNLPDRRTARVSVEKATELAARLVAECGCPVTAAGQWVNAPIDDIGFLFHIAEIAVAEGFAADSEAVSFQSAGIDLATGRR